MRGESISPLIIIFGIIIKEINLGVYARAQVLTKTFRVYHSILVFYYDDNVFLNAGCTWWSLCFRAEATA